MYFDIQKADKPFNPSGMAESEDGNVILTITRSFDNSVGLNLKRRMLI
jgi:hypothetical protein